MKRRISGVISRILVFAMVFTSFNVSGFTAYAAESEGQTYVLTDELKPGKEYIMTWNAAISGNADTSYAFSVDGDGVKSEELAGTYFNSDKSVLTIPKEEDASGMTWAAIWNQGEKAARGFQLQNVATKRWLSNKDTEIATGEDPVGQETKSSSDASSKTFPDYTWNYASAYSGSDTKQLIMYSDSKRFIRYSVGSAAFKLGTTATATDVNNSNVYLYEKTEPS